VHLSTSRLGGAGIAAQRLSSAQNQLPGTDSLLMTRKSFRSELFAQSTKIKLKSKSLTLYQSIKTKKQFGVSTPVSASQIDRNQLLKMHPDIVHIHNWYNLLSLDDLNFIVNQFPTVFTMHDERLITGGCHISFGCQQNISGCHNCPQVLFGHKAVVRSKELLTDTLETGKYSVISPSEWLARKFRDSVEVKNKTAVRVIPNILPYPDLPLKDATKRAETNFLFIAADPLNENKGLKEVVESMKRISNLFPEIKVRLTVIGRVAIHQEFHPSEKNLKLIYLNELTENGVETNMYDADALILASKSENSPNVIGEAQLRKLLVIAPDVGGISELVENNQTGILYNRRNSSLVDALTLFIQMRKLERKAITDLAFSVSRTRHEVKEILRQIDILYLETIERFNS
jgi:glycosyltransferase involved in cell wall biosynthesis